MDLQGTTWSNYHHFSNLISYHFPLACFYSATLTFFSYLEHIRHTPGSGPLYSLYLLPVQVAPTWFPLSLSSCSFSKILQASPGVDYPIKNCNFFATICPLCILFLPYSLLLSNILHILLAYLVCFFSPLGYVVFGGRDFFFFF